MSPLENNWHLVEEMTERLKELKPYKVILFGSYANGNPTRDSDLDVLVILDSNDFVKSFKEKIERKMPISKILLNINYQIAMDILVYSKAEFEHLKKKITFLSKRLRAAEKCFMKDDTKSWEFFAENGIISARKLLDIPRLTGEVAFHCQQSIEKYFKAYLFKHNKQIPKIFRL